MKKTAPSPSRARLVGADPIDDPGHLQVAVRLPMPTVRRVDAIARSMTQPGLSVSRSEALRIALYRGLDALEAESGKKGKRPLPARPRSEGAGHLQTAVRLPSKTVDRIDAIADRLSRPGWEVSRSEALRVALHRGLGALEADKQP
jgi:predicted transcriptional regulator